MKNPSHFHGEGQREQAHLRNEFAKRNPAILRATVTALSTVPDWDNRPDFVDAPAVRFDYGQRVRDMKLLEELRGY